MVQKCFDLALRVLISLTHKDDQWGRKVLRCGFTMGFILRTIHRTGYELHDLRQRTADVSGKPDPTGEGGSDDGCTGDERKDKDPGSYALDTLCLSLGLLTNLVQIVDEAKNVVRITREFTLIPPLSTTSAPTSLANRPQPLLYTQQTRLCKAVYMFAVLHGAGYPHILIRPTNPNYMERHGCRNADERARSRGVLPARPPRRIIRAAHDA